MSSRSMLTRRPPHNPVPIERSTGQRRPKSSVGVQREGLKHDTAVEAKPIDLQKMFIIAVASAVSAGALVGIGNSLSRALGEGMRAPSYEDVNYRGFETVMLRSFLKRGVTVGVQRMILYMLSRAAQSRSPADLRQALVCVAALLSAIAVVAILSPADRVRRYQAAHGGTMLNAGQALVDEGGIQSLYKGALMAVLCALPSQIGNALSEHLAHGDAEKEKAISKKYTMIEAPTTTFLLAIKQVRNAEGLALVSAGMKVGKTALNKPFAFGMHVGLGMVLVQLGKGIYFLSVDAVRGALALMSPLSEQSRPELESDPASHSHAQKPFKRSLKAS